MEYLDFELEIGEPVDELFPIAVRSPAGEARAVVQLPALDGALRRSVVAGRDVAVPGPIAPTSTPSLQAFGRALFDAVFVGEIGALFAATRQAAMPAGGVRIRIRAVTPHSAALPWELLCDHAGKYLALSTQSVVCRYLELARSIRTLGVVPPVRVLVMISTPSGVPALDGASERRRIEEATAALTAAGALEFVWLEGERATWTVLQNRMRTPQPSHVFHFIGHGMFDVASGRGQLALTDEFGAVSWVSGEKLGVLFHDHSPLRLVVLNCCRSAESDEVSLFASTAGQIVASGVPAVVAMQQVVGDTAAIAFAGELYGSLAQGAPVDAAVAEGRKALLAMALATTDFGWALPVLYLRSPDGQLFEIEPPHPPTAPEPSAGPRRVLARLIGGAVGAGLIALAFKYLWFEEADSGGRDKLIACTPPEIECRGTCLDISANPDNCGACGAKCASGACSMSVCMPLAIDAPVCGNGIREGAEECDDGNAINGDGCDRNCSAPRCGNEIVDPSEECDGASVGELACDRRCKLVHTAATTKPPDRNGKPIGDHPVETGALKAGDRSKLKVGNVTGPGNPDVGVKSVTTGSDSTIEIGNKQP